MLSNLKPKSEFSRNVITLMTGTTIAQAIPVAISRLERSLEEFIDAKYASICSNGTTYYTSITFFFPTKILGCYGNGGAVFTNNEALANKMKSLKLNGQSKRYYVAAYRNGWQSWYDSIKTKILRKRFSFEVSSGF